MEDIPQGGAGGAPLDDTEQKHLLRSPDGSDGPDGSDEPGAPARSDEGDGGEGDGDDGGDGDGATTLEPGRARHPEHDQPSKG